MEENKSQESVKRKSDNPAGIYSGSLAIWQNNKMPAYRPNMRVQRPHQSQGPQQIDNDHNKTEHNDKETIKMLIKQNEELQKTIEALLAKGPAQPASQSTEKGTGSQSQRTTPSRH